jgi:hypothetical protein
MKASDFAALFIQHIVANHGMPHTLICDRGVQWNNKFCQTLFSRYGVQLNMSSPYHPQTDGQTERMNRVLEDMLRNYVSPTQLDWDDWLPMIQFAVNNSWQESIKSTPFFLNTGTHPSMPTLAAISKTQSDSPAAKQFAKNIQIAVDRARSCMQAAQHRQKVLADEHRRDATYQPGDLVLLQAKNFRFAAPGAKKLHPKFIGPFTVERMVGKTAVKLRLPSYGNWDRIHDVHHVSLLRPYTARPGDTAYPPPLKFEEGCPVFEVEAIVGHRLRTATVKKGRKQISKQVVSHYLVHWRGWSSEHDTWEPARNLSGAKDIVEQYLTAHQLNS